MSHQIHLLIIWFAIRVAH